MRTAVLTGALAIAVGVLAGCSGSGSLTSDDFSVRTMVGALPSPEGGATAVAVDLDAVDEARGLTRPQDAGDDAMSAWLGSLASASGEDAAGLWAATPDLFQRTNPTENTPLGWGLWDLASYAEVVGAAPLQALVVVGADGALPVDSTVDLGDGVRTLGEGGDNEQDLENVGPLRPLGQPLRIGARDDALVLTGSTSVAEAFASGEEESGGATLADREAMMGVADTLDEHEVVSAVLTDRRFDPGSTLAGAAPDQLVERLATLQGVLPSRQATAIGLGWTPDEDGGSAVVVYRYASPEAAEETAPELERVWAEADSLRSGAPVTDFYTVSEPEVEGETVVLPVSPVGDTPPATLATMLLTGEVVFASL